CDNRIAAVRYKRADMADFSLPQLPDAAIMNAPAVSVVVPLFNEEENVPALQAELRSALAGLDYEIIFVDDGSTDRTFERIATDERVRVIRFEKNTGQSAAMYAGLHQVRGAS